MTASAGLNENNNTEQDLREPLLSQQQEGDDVPVPVTCSNSSSRDGDVEAPSSCSSASVCPTTNNNDANNTPTQPAAFSYKTELLEMMNLGLPLAVSFFCRMGMASTDSAFVGHIHDDQNSPETYLAAAVLSDMVVNVCITPPLAFNQVLNALVGQAMGSGNPKMAGVWLQQSMVWLSLSMAPCLVFLFYVTPILKFLNFPDDVSQVAGTYAKFNLLWPIPNGLYQCMRFYFQAQGLPRPAMYNNLLFLFVNAVLNWTFVFGGPVPGWNGFGFIGAAISLSISRTLQPLLYYLYMFVYKQHHKNTWPEDGWSLQHHTAARTKEFMKQSIPNIGTLLFQAVAGQATTVLVGRLGELSIAASSALSTVTIPWSGTLSASCVTISGVRVGYHLGRGDAQSAKKTAWLVVHFITVVMIAVAVVFVPLQHSILTVATDDHDVLHMAATLVPAMLVGTYLNLIVGNITSGVFSGMGRPFIATLLSFGLELPMSIGGVAIYILVMHGNLIGVYWWQAISGGLEAIIVIVIMVRSNWDVCVQEALQRQEADTATHPPQDGSSSNNEEERLPLTRGETAEMTSEDDSNTGDEAQEEQEQVQAVP